MDTDINRVAAGRTVVAARRPASNDGAGDEISPANLARLSAFVFEYSGIKLPPSKQTMLEGRLRKRLRATGFPTFDAYCDHLFHGGGLEAEAVALIDVVTTNKTDFFREPKHFEFLAKTALPELAASGRQLRAWSAACSTGAEPYTMAMVMEAYAAARGPLSYSILATDISTDVLETARQGIFAEDMVRPVPDDLRRRFVMAPVDPRRRVARIHPDLRSRIGFGRLNLMDERYAIGRPLDIIFCRNVLIYFDKPTQIAVLRRLCDCLAPGGYLFIGHSETIQGADLPVRQAANTVFQRI